MKPIFHRLLGLATGAAIACTATGAMAADITGAGATFPALIYQKWAEAYKAKTGIGLNYQAIGSGALSGLDEARAVVRRSFPTRIVQPAPTADWDAAYERYLAVCSR